MEEGVNDLTAEEEALYDMDDEAFEAALSEAKSERDYQEPEPEVVEEIEEEVVIKEEPETEEVEEEIKTDDLEQSTTDSKNDVQAEPDAEPEVATDAKADDVVVADNSKAEEVKPQSNKYRANGQDFEFTDEEVKAQFGQVFGQAMNYTQKMQEIKPWRSTISALEDNKMSHSDVELMIDVMKGDKGAMNKLMERSGVDPMELDAESAEQAYQPNQYGQSDMELEINDIVKDIGSDPEYSITQDVLSNRWDQASRDAFLENPSLIRKLHIDVKNGDFDVLNNQALKMKTLDGGRKTDIEYYAEAAQYRARTTNSNRVAEANRVEADNKAKADMAAVAAEQEAKVAQVRVQQEKQRQVEAEAEERKAATITQKTSGKKNVVDYLDDDDEAFDEWYKKLESRI